MDIHLYWYINIWYIGIPRCAHTKSPHFARRFHPGADAMSPSRSSTASSPRSAASSSDEPMAPVSQGGKPWSHGYPMDIPRDIRDIPWNPYIFVGETNHHRRSLFFLWKPTSLLLKTSYIHWNVFVKSAGKCSVLGILNIMFRYLLEVGPKKNVGLCER